jgi:hypothetical protein
VLVRMYWVLGIGRGEREVVHAGDCEEDEGLEDGWGVHLVCDDSIGTRGSDDVGMSSGRCY